MIYILLAQTYNKKNYLLLTCIPHTIYTCTNTDKYATFKSLYILGARESDTNEYYGPSYLVFKTTFRLLTEITCSHKIHNQDFKIILDFFRVQRLPVLPITGSSLKNCTHILKKMDYGCLSFLGVLVANYIDHGKRTITATIKTNQRS